MHDAGDGWQRTVIEQLADGDYRVHVTAPGVHPVTDVVSVVDLPTLEQTAEARGDEP